MPYLAEPSQAVHSPRLIQLLIHARYGRYINDSRPAQILPDIRTGEDPPEIVLFVQERNRFLNPSEMHQKGIDISLRSQQGEQNTCHYHPGDEIRQIGNRLDDFLKQGMMDFVQQKGKNNRHHKPDCHRQPADHQRIAENPPHVGKAEKIYPVFEAYEITFEKASARYIIKKGNDISHHGNIAENKHPQKSACTDNPHLFLCTEGFYHFFCRDPVLIGTFILLIFHRASLPVYSKIRVI